MGIIVTIIVLNACFWVLVWGMDRVERMERKEKPETISTYEAPIDVEDIDIEEPYEAKKSYEDDDIVIEDIH